MIGRSFVFMLVFFILHFAASRNAGDIEVTQQSTWSGNVLTAESFLFDQASNYKYLMVGSSQGFRITNDLLPDSTWYNLSLGGLSILDGLELISRKSLAPEFIFVEINVLDRNASSDFTQAIFDPLKYPMKKYLGYGFEKHKPVGLIHNPAERFLRRTLGKLEMIMQNDPKEKPVAKSKPTHEDDLVKQSGMEVLIENFTELPKDKIDDNFTYMLAYLDLLSAKGSDIVFFEMPVDEQLCGLNTPDYIRTKVEGILDHKAFHYIPQPECSEYATTDGVHLGPEMAEKYAGYFNKQAVAIINGE